MTQPAPNSITTADHKNISKPFCAFRFTVACTFPLVYVGLSLFPNSVDPLDVSIIIVNYNVKYFLEQCLYSVCAASKDLAVQVIVVDNASTDGSLAYLKPLFKEVQFIQSKGNSGFAKACNRGLQEATGKYILFLNPDTLLAEDTLVTCLRFFNSHPDAGAVGVRMIDGTGSFLKESKRAFPSPVTSLFKLFGLARLFPQSKTFSRYHLGHLDAAQNHEVDVLAGAFMMIRKDVLDIVGAFDEVFFMYGEDVDLSYRIQKEGYKNYYLADTEIIHFKGESTKRGSLNYVRLFYSAMSTFVQKHYGGSKAFVFNAAIHFAIWVRAALAAVAKLIKWIGLPVMDAALILFSFWLVKEAWILTVKPNYNYPDELLLVALPSYTLVYLIVAYYAGLYDRQYKRSHLTRATVMATVVLLALYALLPEHYRFSRGILVFGALLAFVFIRLLRQLMVRTKLLQISVEKTARPDLLIAGTASEAAALRTLLQPHGLHRKIIGRLAVDGHTTDAIATIDETPDMATALNAKELAICAGPHFSYKTIIRFIQKTPPHLRLRFHAAGSGSLVGSDSSSSSGAAFSANAAFNLSKPTYRRAKRLIDVLFSILFLLLFPFSFLIFKKPLHFLNNVFRVLAGHKTFIGYITTGTGLPTLRPAVLASNGLTPAVALNLSTENHALVDYWYAKNYEPLQDVKLILKNGFN